jgi:hypothetical protein
MKWPSRIFWAGGLALIGLGVLARFYAVTNPDFVYYDEGLYLIHNIKLLYFLDANPPHTFALWMESLGACWQAALSDTKTLWFFLVSLRVFICGVDCLVFPKVLSAVFGALTIPVVYVFGRRLFSSRSAGLLSAVLLAVLPGHIYYSRLGLQEALSALCFSLGFFCYLTGRRWWVRSLVAGFWFGCVFFTNYRMIIIPALLFAVEAVLWAGERAAADWRRWLYATLTFAAVVFGVGALNDGANTKVTFGWMFHQAHSSAGTFDWFNLWSYPFYQFYLESPIWGALFVAQGFRAVRKCDRQSALWIVVFAMMALFSLPQEKGVRYLCSALPLLCLSTGAFLRQGWLFSVDKRWRPALAAVVLLMLGWHALEGWRISRWTTGYARAVEDLKEKQPYSLKMSSSQPVLMGVIAGEGHLAAKPAVTFSRLVTLRRLGYRYLVLDPQAYVSYTENGYRFEKKLTPFLEFIRKNIPPETVYPHFSKRLLARFVLEHNENLRRSLAFIRYAKDQPVNRLYVYDINKIFIAAEYFLNAKNHDR